MRVVIQAPGWPRGGRRVRVGAVLWPPTRGGVAGEHAAVLHRAPALTPMLSFNVTSVSANTEERRLPAALNSPLNRKGDVDPTKT